MENKNIPTNYYVKIAEEHLEEMVQQHSTQKLTLYGSCDINPHSILAAMLKHALNSGGWRYAACAIVSCKREVAIQVSLANTWLCYLLLPGMYILM